LGALDRDNDTVYLCGEHYRGHAEPPIHAVAIKARGNLPGWIDPASNASSQVDGQRLLPIYRGLGLSLQTADNAREAGIYAAWTRLSTGRLKVFQSCRNWLDEFRIFARDENGKIINESKFHLMAATRYLLLDTLGQLARCTAKRAKATPRVFVAKSFCRELDALMLREHGHFTDTWPNSKKKGFRLERRKPLVLYHLNWLRGPDTYRIDNF
jgi:hypothetical protein